MKPPSILLGLLLVFSAGVAIAQEPPADTLDGKAFRSVEKLPGGDRPDGTVNQIHWQVCFKGDSFTWLHYDKIAIGTYTFDARTGTVTAKGGPGGSFEAKTGILTWGTKKYMLVK